MVESALHHIKILEDLDFHNIIVSMKASDVHLAIEAYEKAAKAFDYPVPNIANKPFARTSNSPNKNNVPSKITINPTTA